MPRSKARNQRAHTFQRAQARFGLNLSDRAQTAICEKIRKGDAQFVRRDSNRVSIFDVEYEGQTLRAVYDKERKQLATVLLTEMN